jgi:hypothetical protein
MFEQVILFMAGIIQLLITAILVAMWREVLALRSAVHQLSGAQAIMNATLRALKILPD